MTIGDEKKVTFESYPLHYLSILSFNLLLMKTMRGVQQDLSYLR